MLEQVAELPRIKAPSLQNGLSRLSNLLGGRSALRQTAEPFPLDPLNPRELEAATAAVKEHAASVLPPDTPLRFNICTLQARCFWGVFHGLSTGYLTSVETFATRDLLASERGGHKFRICSAYRCTHTLGLSLVIPDLRTGMHLEICFLATASAPPAGNAS